VQVERAVRPSSPLLIRGFAVRVPGVAVADRGHPGSMPPVLVATVGLAMVRLHGHSAKWDSHNIYEQFGCHYQPEELTS
jgi:hypothetical protein